MSTRRVILFIAMSVDGYIAREDGDIEFLSSMEAPGEDYGYGEFVKTVDTVIMGRKTYDKVMSFGIEFPHRGRKCYVLSRTRTGVDENVEFYDGDIRMLIGELRSTQGLDIFIDGGSEVVFELMQRNLIDRYIVSIIPTLVGKGIPLFRNGRPEQKLTLVRSQSYPSGLVQLWYDRAEGA